MVLSDVLYCICFPCRFPISVFMYKNGNEMLLYKINDDDCFFGCNDLLDNEVLSIDFDRNCILLSDKQVHT